MLNATYVPARDLQKSYKKIIQFVIQNGSPVILTTNKRPQAAIVNLEELEHLRKQRNLQAHRELLALARKARKEVTYLPADLRDRADEILYGKSNL